jgi:hypothetical protein
MTALSPRSQNTRIVVVLDARDCRAAVGAHMNMTSRKDTKT